MDVAVDLGGTFDGGARDAQEVEVYGQEELAHDLQVRLGKQNMDVRHATGNRILDRNHGQLCLPAGNQLESVLEAGAGNAFQLGEHLLTRDIGVGAGFTLVRNLLGHGPYAFTPGASSPNWVPTVSLRDLRPGLKMRRWSTVDAVACGRYSAKDEGPTIHPVRIGKPNSLDVLAGKFSETAARPPGSGCPARSHQCSLRRSRSPPC